MYRQVPGRRGGGKSPAPTGETNRLQFTKEEFQQAKKFLAGLCSELSVSPQSDEGSEGEITLVVDPRAMSLVQIYVRGLHEFKEAETATGVKATDLDALRNQAVGLGVILSALQTLRGDLVFSRLIVAAAQGVMWDEQVDKLTEDLRSAGKTEEEREELKASAKEVLTQVEREQEQKALRLEQLKKARLSAQTRLDQASKRRRLMEALLDLQDDNDVSPALRDELIAIYEESVRIPGEDTRQAPR